MAPTTRSSSRREVLQQLDENKENHQSVTVKLSENEGQSMCASNFELLEDLGGGAQSVVVKGRHKLDGKTYAIKMINYNCNRKYADRELKIHKSIDFPGVVQLLGHYFVSDPPKKTLCLVLEYCPQTMLDLLKSKPEGRLSENDAANYLQQIAETLAHLHENKIMHRDIKLSNILVTEDGKAKIADFGISTSIRDPRMRQTIIGTEGYMAPEIENNTATSREGEILLKETKEKGAGLAGLDIPIGVEMYDSQYSEKVDIWSLGATLFAMVTGNLPCENDETEYNSDFDFCFDDSPPSMFDFEMLDSVSPDACDLILGLMEEDPDERLSVEEVLDHPWVKKYA